MEDTLGPELNSKENKGKKKEKKVTAWSLKTLNL